VFLLPSTYYARNNNIIMMITNNAKAFSFWCERVNRWIVYPIAHDVQQRCCSVVVI